VGWLGVTKVALGWPLYLVAVAGMGAVLLRGRTPLDFHDAGSADESAPGEGTVEEGTADESTADGSVPSETAADESAASQSADDLTRR
jgi:hypothetical protein